MVQASDGDGQKTAEEGLRRGLIGLSLVMKIKPRGLTDGWAVRKEFGVWLLEPEYNRKMAGVGNIYITKKAT